MPARRRLLNAVGAGCIVLMGAWAMLPAPVAGQAVPDRSAGDQELAKLLVKLLVRTRAAIAKQYETDRLPGWDHLVNYVLVKNEVLPAAVAAEVFHAVSELTGGRAWVRMVVDNPRNPNNQGDETASRLLAELRRGPTAVERLAKDAYYYAEPIRAKAWCLRCHGEPKGQPDPMFPKYTKDGWKDGDVIGAVVARVAPAK